MFVKAITATSLVVSSDVRFLAKALQLHFSIYIFVYIYKSVLPKYVANAAIRYRTDKTWREIVQRRID